MGRRMGHGSPKGSQKRLKTQAKNAWRPALSLFPGLSLCLLPPLFRLPLPHSGQLTRVVLLLLLLIALPGAFDLVLHHLPALKPLGSPLKALKGSSRLLLQAMDLRLQHVLEICTARLQLLRSPGILQTQLW